MNNEKPEVYALHQDDGNWQISRRDFLKAAGVGAAALGIGLESGCSRAKPLYMICGNMPSHKYTIIGLTLSADGRYLLSFDKGGVNKGIIKCWDFEKQALLGSSRQTFGNYAAGYYEGRSCLFLIQGSEKYAYLEIPLTESAAEAASVEALPELTLPDANAACMVFDSSENVFVSGSGIISLYRKSDNYQQREVLCDEDLKKSVGIKKIQLFNDEKSLFIKWNGNRGFGILDLESRELTSFEKALSETYAILPDQEHVLNCSAKSYSLMSLKDGTSLWTQKGPQPGGGENYQVKAAAVTPDGRTGILIVVYNQRCFLFLVSLTDGSEIARYDLGDLQRSDKFAGPVLAPDGTKMAVSVDKTIFFFSLPDLQLIGCPVDMNESEDDVKGIEISAADEATGASYTYTLPCGAAIPKGAVCTCNCVKGRGGCACDGHSRSNRSNGSSRGGRYYWHPN